MIDTGIYPDLSNEDYHADPALGSSMMSLLKKSPAHLRAYLKHPPEPTPAMKFGAEYHNYCLGGNYEITPKNLPIIKDMYSVLKAHPIASKLLSGGEPEVSYFWRHRKYGFMCKCRPDYRKGNTIIDLKTTTDASPESFSRAIANFGYHRQGDHYLSGVAEHGIEAENFVIIAQEKKPPYPVAIYRLSEEDLYLGHLENDLIYQTYTQCKALKEWPGYPEKIQSIALPKWYFRQASI